MVTRMVLSHELLVRLKLPQPIGKCLMNDSVRLSFLAGLIAGILLLDVIYFLVYFV